MNTKQQELQERADAYRNDIKSLGYTTKDVKDAMINKSSKLTLEQKFRISNYYSKTK